VAQATLDSLDGVLALRYVLGALELLFVDPTPLVRFELGVGRVLGRISLLSVLPAPSANASTSTAPRAQWLLEGNNQVHTQK